MVTFSFCFAFTGFASNATALCAAKKCEYLCLPAVKEGNSPLVVSCACENGKEVAADGRSCVTAGKAVSMPHFLNTLHLSARNCVP